MATLLENRVSAVQLDGGQSGSAPAYACRAWVNFNGGGTVTIRGSGNVSSITDNGLGDYTVNFTTAMPNVNYAAVITPAKRTGNPAQGALLGYSTADPTTTALRFNCLAFDALTNVDMDFVNVAIFG
jgi:hypothetical protein